MENNNDIFPIEEQTQLFNDIDNIPRCVEYNIISSLKLFYKEGKPIVNYNCENIHKGNIPIEEYMNKYNNNSLSKQKCE